MGSERPRTAPPARWSGEDGNTLLLMPVAVLMVLVFSAIAVDAALMFTAQREATSLADGLARTATGAVDEAALFDGGDYAIDLDRATAATAARLAVRPPSTHPARCDAPVHGDTPDQVIVTCEVTVDLIFTRAFRSSPTYTANVSGVARAAEGA